MLRGLYLPAYTHSPGSMHKKRAHVNLWLAEDGDANEAIELLPNGKFRKRRRAPARQSKKQAGVHVVPAERPTASQHSESDIPAIEHYPGDITQEEAIKNLDALPAFVHRGKVTEYKLHYIPSNVN